MDHKERPTNSIKTKSKSKSKTGSKSKTASKSDGNNKHVANHQHHQQQHHKINIPSSPSNTIVDVELDKWPFCIVWTPLPVITWFIPIIGHTGIANSKGIIYDFSDDYNVSVDNFSFGTPTKYYQFEPSYVRGGAKAWDKAIQETSDYYTKTRHSLCFNNCHQYIADVLNKIKYENRDDWDTYEIWYMITFNSSYTGFLGLLRQWWPFTVIIMIIILLFILLVF